MLLYNDPDDKSKQTAELVKGFYKELNDLIEYAS